MLLSSGDVNFWTYFLGTHMDQPVSLWLILCTFWTIHTGGSFMPSNLHCPAHLYSCQVNYCWRRAESAVLYLLIMREGVVGVIIWKVDPTFYCAPAWTESTVCDPSCPGSLRWCSASSSFSDLESISVFLTLLFIVIASFHSNDAFCRRKRWWKTNKQTRKRLLSLFLIP